MDPDSTHEGGGMSDLFGTSHSLDRDVSKSVKMSCMLHSKSKKPVNISIST